jgi:carbon-monoxide dehydrogenase medium subunit
LMFKPQQYFRPLKVGEAVRVLTKNGRRSKPIAGGTDLLVDRPRGINCLVDLTRLGLAYVKSDRNVVRIGACTTLSQVEKARCLRKGVYNVVKEAASQVGGMALRNTATVGGNLCRAAPSADMAPPLIALGAGAKIVGLGRQRTVALDSFFKGPGMTCLKPGELLVEVQIPKQPDKSTGAFVKLRRSSVDIALVNACVRVTLEKDGKCREATIVVGGVARTPLRAKKAEHALRGRTISDRLIEHTAQIASDETRPISDARSSAGHRRRMTRLLVGKALRQALNPRG